MTEVEIQDTDTKYAPLNVIGFKKNALLIGKIFLLKENGRNI